MKTTQYQPFWVLERVLFLSNYWHPKEYLDISEHHSISTFLSIGKSTLFVSLLDSKRVLRYKWRSLNIKHFDYWKEYSICLIIGIKKSIQVFLSHYIFEETPLLCKSILIWNYKLLWQWWNYFRYVNNPKMFVLCELLPGLAK